MTHSQKWLTLTMLVLSLVLPGKITIAQEGGTPTSTPPQPGIVPDLTGLSVPEAATRLNRNSLLLGQTFTVGWAPDSPIPPNLIGLGGQSIAPGQSVALGTPVDVAISRAPNAALIYDDNDITLVNRSGVQLDITSLVFSSIDGTGQATFAATRWSTYLRENQCWQLWTVGRNGPKAVDGCGFIQGYLSTTNPVEHFWTGSNGATQFQVIQNGLPVTVCNITAGQCEFYLQLSNGLGDETSYVYLAYTNDRLIIMNNTANQWMPLTGLVLYNNFVAQPGIPTAIGDPALFGNPVVYGQIDRLAPGQCLYFTNGSPADPNPPQPCDVIARLDLTASNIFWGAAFDIDGVTRERNSTCPAGAAGQLIICAMPR